MDNKPIIIARNPKGDHFLIQRGTKYCLLNNYGDLVPRGVSNWKGIELYHKCLMNGFEEVVPFEYEGDKVAKADNSHLSDNMERYSYQPSSNYNTIYIPINRLKMVYQTPDSINPRKVNENYWKMKNGVALDPVWVGYDYDVHDGHHRIEASKKMKHSHVPCKVVGADKERVKQAIEDYKKLWKSDGSETEWNFI